MSLLGKQTYLVKCPSCQATTKVSVHPDKLSIRCPRCQVTIPLAFAKKYSKDQPSVPENQPRQPDVQSGAYGSEVPIEAPSRNSSSSRRKKSQRGYDNSTEFNYPDHSKSFVNYAYLAAALFGVACIAAGAYVYWGTLVNTRNQEYINNVHDAVDLHTQALTQIRKVLDPLESNEATKAYREAKGKIEFLATQRRKMSTIDPNKNEEMKQWLEKLTNAEKELLAAETDVKRLTTETKAPVVKDEPNSVASHLGSSTTVGPTKPATTVNNVPPPTKTVDDKTVTINIPGITKTQWNDEFVRRFALLADNGEGQVKVNWSGDLLSLEVRPVVDPARYATKINFARLVYYSRNERIIMIEFKPERVNNYTAQGDSITPILIDLKQREKVVKILPALGQLGNLKVDPSRQAEVAAILELLVGDIKLDSTVRAAAIKLLPSWNGKDSAELLIRLMDEKDGVVRLTALDALVETRATTAATALVKRWEKLDADRVTRGLVALGSEVEPVVLPYLVNNNSIIVRTEACKVLKEIGTSESLKPLLDLMNSKDQTPVVANAAKEAMKGILDRNSK